MFGLWDTTFWYSTAGGDIASVYAHEYEPFTFAQGEPALFCHSVVTFLNLFGARPLHFFGAPPYLWTEYAGIDFLWTHWSLLLAPVPLPLASQTSM